MIDGNTILIAHLGYPTTTFKAPLIYNPYFESIGVNAVVMPMAVEADVYPEVLAALFRLKNIRGALVTMPHKVTTTGLVDELSTAASIAGSCNAVLLRPDGTLRGDMFDGEGFGRGVLRKGRQVAGALGLFDLNSAAVEGLARRLRAHYPALALELGTRDPEGYDIVVNATPLGMNEGDPLPMDVSRIAPESFVGEVVLKSEVTPFLAAARARGCQTQIGTDMLFEQIPAYLEFFGFPTTTPDNLRAVAQISY